jgi:hypothetical protein
MIYNGNFYYLTIKPINMRTNRMLRGMFTFFGIAALAVTVSCKQIEGVTGTAQDDGRISEEAQAGSQTAQILDERIREFNQEMATVEREVMASESVGEEGFRQEWREIEVKRHQLNSNIDRYNAAVERDATLEASEIRGDINKLLGELQTDLKEFRSEYGGTEQMEQQQLPEQQEEPFQQDDDYRDDGVIPQK